MKQLLALVTAFPELVVDCLALWVQSDKQGWEIGASEQDIKSILAVALKSSESAVRSRSVALVNALGELGYIDFGKLLE